LPHQGSLANPPGSQQEKVVGLQVAPECCHLVGAIEEVLTLGDGAGHIPHKPKYTTKILYSGFFVQ
jgi:hypothetical protein